MFKNRKDEFNVDTYGYFDEEDLQLSLNNIFMEYQYGLDRYVEEILNNRIIKFNLTNYIIKIQD